jgi:hypothetical protein
VVTLYFKVLLTMIIMATSNKRLIAILSTAAFLLLIPVIGIQFPTTGFNWSVSDFIVAGVLLFGTGLTIEFVLRRVKALKYRLIICGAILFVLFLVWAELAVGLFGTPFAGS